MLDSSYIGLRHVATCPFDLTFLIFTEHFIEEPINRFASFSLTNPNNTRTVKVVDDGSIFMPFAVRDLVNADRLKPPNSMSITYTCDSTMELIRKG